jgi:predicted DNA-binding transcriptional regulator YafY
LDIVRADRLLSILLLLQARGRMSTRDLADRLEVSRRTVFRDLEALSSAGVPVVADRGPAGGVQLLEGYRTDLTGLTESELEALFAFSGSGLAADLGMRAELERASNKVTTAAGRTATTRLRQRVLVDTRRWGAPPEAPPHLATVQDALWADRRVRLRYPKSGDGERDVVVEPYGLVAKAGNWYLLAAVGDGLRVYRVSRIQRAEVLPERFERQPDFRLEAAWDAQVGSFPPRDQVQVEVRVAPAVAARFARVAGDSLTAPLDDDGRAVLAFPAVGAAAATLSGFGDDVEVLSPPELRERLADLGRRLVARYTGPDSVSRT